MLTLLTTLESEAPLFRALWESGLVSSVLRTREELDAVSDASVLLVNWPYILTADFISQQKVVLNVHNSLLPRYRGRHAFTWAILNGEQKLGFSLHEVVSQVDAGGVLAQISFSLPPEEDINDALRHGERLLLEWLPATLRQWAEGRLVACPQDDTQATTFRRRCAADNWLGVFDSAERVRNLVRAVAPPYTPGAMCRIPTGSVMHFASAKLVDATEHALPGLILAIKDSALSVACSSGTVLLFPVETELLKGLRLGDVLSAAAQS